MNRTPDPVGFAARHPDHLCLILIGPGFGESGMVRVPGCDWIVVDGCEHAGESLPAKLLGAMDARAAAVVLTHPHEDHVRGLTAVLERTVPDGLFGCYAPLVDRPSPWRRSGDSETRLVHGSREHVLASIQDRWERTPASEWNLVSGSERKFGEAKLLALHPETGATLPAPAQANAVCNAILVTWKE